MLGDKNYTVFEVCIASVCSNTKVQRSVAQKSSTVVYVRHVTSLRIDATFSYCHPYICAFTSNYPGRGNPVTAAYSTHGGGSKARYSKLLHSLAVSVVTTMLPGPARRGIIHVYVVDARLGLEHLELGQLPNAHLCSTDVNTQLRAIIVTIPFPCFSDILYWNFRFRFSSLPRKGH